MFDFITLQRYNISMKICSNCNKLLDKSQFNISKTNKDGLYSYCKLCAKIISKNWRTKNKKHKAAYEKNWRENNREKHRAIKVHYKYGLCEKELNSMLLEQNYSCKICGMSQSEMKKALCVDHCHETGKVRGLLCDNCNKAIGLLKDSVRLLNNAITYLSK